jgi:hypothetical protein
VKWSTPDGGGTIDAESGRFAAGDAAGIFRVRATAIDDTSHHGDEYVIVSVPPPPCDSCAAGALARPLSSAKPPQTVPMELAIRWHTEALGNAALRFDIDLPTGDAAVLDVVDVVGRRVVHMDLAGLGPGRHSVSTVPGGPGVYFVRLRQGDRIERAQAILLR